MVTKFSNQSHTHNLYRWPLQHAIASYCSHIFNVDSGLGTRLHASLSAVLLWWDDPLQFFLPAVYKSHLWLPLPSPWWEAKLFSLKSCRIHMIMTSCKALELYISWVILSDALNCAWCQTEISSNLSIFCSFLSDCLEYDISILLLPYTKYSAIKGLQWGTTYKALIM